VNCQIDPSSAEPHYAALVAIDWGDQKHVWCLQPADSQRREHGTLPHTPEAVHAWVGDLMMRFPGQPIAVAVEQSRGALAVMLRMYEQLHLYPIHPRTAAQFRAALYPSGAKDDPVDADLLLDLLVHHRQRLRHCRPDSVQVRLIQQLVEIRRRLVAEKTRQSNRLTAQLKVYYPQILVWFEDVASELVGDFLQRWPSLTAVQRARPETVQSFFTQHHCRNADLIQRRQQQITEATLATTDEAVLAASQVLVDVLIHELATLRQGIATLDQQIEQATTAHPDYRIFRSFPGAGAVIAPRLVAAFGSLRDRFGSADEMQTFSGVSPIVVRSGKSAWVQFRRACPKFLRQTFHEWAGHSIPFCDWAKAYYQQQRARGADHHAAVRALAFKWIRIAYRCWVDHTPYDDARYVASLRRRGSPLVQFLVKENT
jgi:transposase